MKNRIELLALKCRLHPRLTLTLAALVVGFPTWLVACQVATSFSDDGMEFDFTGEIYVVPEPPEARGVSGLE